MATRCFHNSLVPSSHTSLLTFSIKGKVISHFLLVHLNEMKKCMNRREEMPKVKLILTKLPTFSGAINQKNGVFSMALPANTDLKNLMVTSLINLQTVVLIKLPCRVPLSLDVWHIPFNLSPIWSSCLDCGEIFFSIPFIPLPQLTTRIMFNICRLRAMPVRSFMWVTAGRHDLKGGVTNFGLDGERERCGGKC